MNFKKLGRLSDLSSIDGVHFYNARRGIPTTEIESKRPFIVRYFNDDGSIARESYPLFRDSRLCEHSKIQHPPTWFISFDGHSSSSDDRYFTLIPITNGNQNHYYWQHPTMISDALKPLINQSGDFFTDFFGVGKGYQTKSLNDLSIDQVKRIAQATTETLCAFKEQYKVEQLYIKTSPANNKNKELITYINLVTMKMAQIDL